MDRLSVGGEWLAHDTGSAAKPSLKGRPQLRVSRRTGEGRVAESGAMAECACDALVHGFRFIGEAHLGGFGSGRPATHITCEASLRLDLADPAMRRAINRCGNSAG